MNHAVRKDVFCVHKTGFSCQVTSYDNNYYSYVAMYIDMYDKLCLYNFVDCTVHMSERLC